jgi:YD repeat-containing protein
VTPFELAGSEVLTGIDINWALQDKDDAFQAVVNLAVLLHSLDQDAKPENGIQIRQSVAELLNGLSLDTSQHWRTFQEDSRLRALLGKSSRTKRFSKPHGISRPVTATKYLYSGLNIDAKTVGLSQQSSGEPGELFAYTEYFYYDRNGSMTRHDDGTSNAFEIWDYSSSGDVIRHERDAKMYVGHDIETWDYDSTGNIVLREWDYQANGEPDRFESRRYDRNYNLIELSSGYGAGIDDTYSNAESFSYDDKGQLIRKETRYGDTMGSVETWQYDAAGRPIESTQRVDFGDDMSGGSRQFWLYDDNGRLEQIRQEPYSQSSGGSTTEFWEYDDRDRVISKELVYGSGTVGRTQTWEYDEKGNMTRYESDGGWCEAGHPTGHKIEHEIADRCSERWQYHDNGNISLQEIEASLRWRGEQTPITGVWRYEYDYDGRLARYESHPYEYGNDFAYRQRLIMNWHYDSDGKLIQADASSTNGTPLYTETWHYDSDRKLRRYERYEHESGNEMAAEIIRFQYENTGWGHLFADSPAWRHEFSVPLKPQPYPGSRYFP